MKRDRGSGSIFQPTWKDAEGRVCTSPTWFIQYYYRGKRKRESSFSSNRNEAVKLLRKRQGEMGRGQLIGPDAEKVEFDDLMRITLDDAKMIGNKSVKRMEYAANRLQEFFGQDRALDITTDRITAYALARGAAPGTVQYELAILKHAFNLAVRAGKLHNRPYFPTIRVRNTRQGFFEEAEFRAVQGYLSEDLQFMAEFAYLTGWRKQEILKLQWAQIDFGAGMMRLEPGSTKNDEGRMFPFRVYPALKVLLEAQRARTDQTQLETGQIIPWVFHRQGKPIRDYTKAWRAACMAAGQSGKLMHDFRRTAVRNLERAAVPRSVAMKLTGHLTESVYKRYAIVCETDLTHGVEKLAASQTPLSPKVVWLQKKEKKG